MTADQKRLLDRLGTGDSSAFEALVAPFRSELERAVRRILPGQPSLAEEAMQESLLNAYRSLRAGARPEHLRAWLHTIVRNTALNAVRDRRMELPFDEHHKAPVAETASVVEQQEWMDWLMGAIGALPSRQRDAIVAQAFEGRSHLEIAARMQTSVPAVRTLLFRARRALAATRPSTLGAWTTPLLVAARRPFALLKHALPVKKGAASAWQLLAAATVASSVLVISHGATEPTPAGGQPALGHVRIAQAAAAEVRAASSKAGAQHRESEATVKREGHRALRECLHGQRLSRSMSTADLRYASRQLSESDREYTDCESVLGRGVVSAGGQGPGRTVYMAQAPGGIALSGSPRDRFSIEPEEVTVIGHEAWMVVGLRWSRWGTGHAAAVGTSLERSCEPGCDSRSETGSYVRSRAHLELWRPGRFAGRLVYRCFALKDAATVPSAEQGCI